MNIKSVNAIMRKRTDSILSDSVNNKSNAKNAISFKGDLFSATSAGVLMSLAIGAQDKADLEKAHVPEMVNVCNGAMNNPDGLNRQCRAACGKLYMELGRGVGISIENTKNAAGQVRQFCRVIKIR